MTLEKILGSFVLIFGLGGCVISIKYPLIDYARRGFSNRYYCNNKTLDDVECGKYRVYPLVVVDIK